MADRIIVIGRTCFDDYVTLCKIGEWFESERNNKDISIRLHQGMYEEFDMATKSDLGDAVDAIESSPAYEISLVVALHLFGINTLPGPSYHIDLNPTYTYNKRNGELLRMCMYRKIPLVVNGDQPWLGMESRCIVHPNGIYIYEPFSRTKNERI